MFMNSGNAHTNVFLISTGWHDRREGVSVSVEWQLRCVLESDEQTERPIIYPVVISAAEEGNYETCQTEGERETVIGGEGRGL